jgi:hypothetical protein
MRAGGFRLSFALPCAWLATALFAWGQVTELAIAEDTPSQPWPLNTIGLDETRPISFFTKSSNPVLVPEGNVQFRHRDGGAIVGITPALNETGTTSLSVHATDGLTTTTQVVNVTVTAVNDAPTLSRIPDQMISESGSTVPISFTIGDVETPAASLIVSARSSDSSLLPNEAISISGSGALRTLTAMPNEGRSGTVRATVIVSDGEATTSREFQIRVGTVNHAPVANAGPDQTLLATNTTALNGTATDDQTHRLIERRVWAFRCGICQRIIAQHQRALWHAGHLHAAVECLGWRANRHGRHDDCGHRQRDRPDSRSRAKTPII